ncbi:MAG: hypothetical protein KKA16_15300 [Alphaproteobacteria bacterium]|nr:hypothetical protein [Alphaproteobacteria bacterium]MBU2379250.1 hypothetical protein [Alphaproteobacteria bacterium]
MTSLKAPSRISDLAGPALVAWGALAGALVLGGADVRHYWMAFAALLAAGAGAFVAWRLGRLRTAAMVLVLPPLLVAGGVILFMIRLIIGFFG